MVWVYYVVVCCGVVGYGAAWYGMVRCGMVWALKVSLGQVRPG